MTISELRNARKVLKQMMPYRFCGHLMGKPDYTLVPVKGFLDAVEEVRQYGKKKYPDADNWKKAPKIEYWKALLRHIVKAWHDIDAIDPESGCKHTHHAAFNLACLLELEEKE